MLIINDQRCLSCAGCIGLCPDSALFLDLCGLKVRMDLCSLCGICVGFCPVIALVLEGDNPEKAEGDR